MEIRDWLLLFAQEFRKILNSKEYKDYIEFFRAFSGDINYITLDLIKIYYNGTIHSYELRIHKGLYGDNIRIRNIRLKSSIGITDHNDRLSIEMENEAKIQDSYGEPTEFDEEGRVIDFDYFYPLQTISLPLNFQDLEISAFVKKEIDDKILFQLNELKNMILLHKCLNRLSLISEDSLEKITDFFTQDWTSMSDIDKIPIFDKIFFYLGFETIPIELLLNQEKYRDLNSKSHPELILYDLNSNFILLFEELTKLTKEYLYKKDTIKAIIDYFHYFFRKYNRRIDFLYVVSEEVSIDVEHYNLEYRVISKDDLVEKLSKVFKEDILTVEIRKDKRYIKDLEEVLNFFKKG